MEKKSKAFDREREFKVLLEEMNGSIKLIAEDVSDLRSMVKAMAGNLAATMERVTMLEISQRAMRTDINELKVDVRTLKEDVGVLKKDMAEIKPLLKSHDNRITALEAAK